jgi:hypothetical protein
MVEHFHQEASNLPSSGPSNRLHPSANAHVKRYAITIFPRRTQ